MLTQIIVGESFKKIKYHGEVKYFQFECNQCHTKFERLESYFSKQLKRRQNACCFCSPSCRAKYINDHLPLPTTTFLKVKENHYPQKGFFKSFLRAILP